jgi:hypothetical protein
VAATAVQAQANKKRGYASVAERVSKASVQVAGVGRKKQRHRRGEATSPPRWGRGGGGAMRVRISRW